MKFVKQSGIETETVMVTGASDVWLNFNAATNAARLYGERFMVLVPAGSNPPLML